MTEVRRESAPMPLPPATKREVEKLTRGGPVPRLDTYWRVERIVRDAHEHEEDPVSFEEIKRRLGVKSVRHSTIRACVAEMERQGNVVITQDGVLWCPMSREAVVWESKRKWVAL